MFKLPVSFMTLFLVAASPYQGDPGAAAARVNGAAVTYRQIEAEIDRLIPYATYHGSISEERRDEFRRKALNNLVNNELMYQDAVARGLKPDKKRVKTLVKQVRNRFSSRKEYKQALKRSGVTEDQLRTQAEKAALIAAAVEKTITAASRASEQDLREYYDENVQKYRQPESVRLRIISTKKEAKAKDALARVTAGEDFGGIAARMSEDNYRIKGGDIGYVHKGRILPELEEAAFRMKPGEVSGPIRADGRLFIIKLEDKQAERQFTFEEIKDKLKKELEARRSRELKDKWIAELKSKAKIEILAEKSGQKADHK